MIYGGFFDLEVKQTEIAEREQLSEQPGFWDDANQAQKIMQEISERKEWIAIWESAQISVHDAEALLQLAEEMGDSSMEQEIDTEISSAKDAVDNLELRKILSAPDDHRNAILTIHAGAGGTEAQDWSEMLMRMYTRWCDKRGFQVFLADEQPGDEAGV